jgi:hypothetical protein
MQILVKIRDYTSSAYASAFGGANGVSIRSAIDAKPSYAASYFYYSKPEA